MLKAHGQAEQYARALPNSEGRPPFLVVVDVGHSIELYSEFSRTGGTYIPFPDPRSHRILLGQLENADTCETLRLVFSDPLALDPARRSARVTRHIAEKLGRLAPSATDDTILTHLCALNAQRATEERNGQIRYLRPSFQNPIGTTSQTTLAADGMEGNGPNPNTNPSPSKVRLTWPKSLLDQVQAIKNAIASNGAPVNAISLARQFVGAKPDHVSELLSTLAILGHVRDVDGENYVSM